MNIITSSVFSTQQFDLGNGNWLTIIDIEQIDSALEGYIDQKFIHICEGHASANLADVKQRLIKFLNTKVDSTTEMGAIVGVPIKVATGFHPLWPSFSPYIGH